MASGTLTSNTGTITFNTNQVNSITFDTGNKFVDNDIVITTKVTKAVLDGTTDHTSFDIQIPAGSTTVIFNFAIDSDGNVVVT